MDERRFDQITRGLATPTTRRRALKGIAGGAAGGLLSLFGVAGAAADDKDKDKDKKPDCCPKDAPKLCSRACVDTRNDPANCGKCDVSCGPGGQCVDGKCTAAQCTSAANCPTPAGQCQVATCTAGKCGVANAPQNAGCTFTGGFAGVCCAGVCVNVTGDEANCGSCGSTCAADQMCLNGRCGCAPGTVTGTPCTAGLGVCERTGVLVCNNNGAYECNAIAGPPNGPEVCNGLDDDCDGQVDEGAMCPECQVCAGGACVPVTNGSSCFNGTCQNGVCTSSACSSPADCPQSDDPCQAATCTSGVCGFAHAPAGTVCGDETCSGDTYTRPSTCDGAGGCVAGATVSCDDANPCTTHSCEPGIGCVQTSLPTGTICPGGTCQDGVCRVCTPGAACSTGLPGMCATGTIQCVAGQAVCAANYTPQPEICNGLDDDCDGVVDEGALCPECEVCAGGACRPGPNNVTCAGGTCCGGNCIDTFFDTDNCGACGRRCTCPPGRLAICDMGACSCEVI